MAKASTSKKKPDQNQAQKEQAKKLFPKNGRKR
jgi:hypothetical protein